MVTVDPRSGSAEIKPLLDSLHLKTELRMMPAADFAFDGDGPKGKSRIGIERKTVKDLLACMRDNRLVGVQIPRLVLHYDVRYLLIEGMVRANPRDNLLEQAYQAKDGKVYWKTVELGRQRFMLESLGPLHHQSGMGAAHGPPDAERFRHGPAYLVPFPLLQ